MMLTSLSPLPLCDLCDRGMQPGYSRGDVLQCQYKPRFKLVCDVWSGAQKAYVVPTGNMHVTTRAARTSYTYTSASRQRLVWGRGPTPASSSMPLICLLLLLLRQTQTL